MATTTLLVSIPPGAMIFSHQATVLGCRLTFYVREYTAQSIDFTNIPEASAPEY
jgi:hypothetical protein